MKVLAIYPFGVGLEQAFRARGHDVYTIDFKDQRKEYHVDQVVLPEDMGRLQPDEVGEYDVILARPFCPTYSRGAYYMHYRDNVTGVPTDGPRGDKAREADALVQGELRFIRCARPRLGWILENPHGSLRKCDWMKEYPVQSVTLCQYGDTVRKETDLFGVIPRFEARACAPGSDCHPHSNWMKLKKGSSWNKAAMPFQLSLEICLAFEAVA